MPPTFPPASTRDWLKIILWVAGAVAGTVIWAYATFETAPTHQTDVQRIESKVDHIDSDMHQLLRKFGRRPTHREEKEDE